MLVDWITVVFPYVSIGPWSVKSNRYTVSSFSSVIKTVIIYEGGGLPLTFCSSSKIFQLKNLTDFILYILLRLFSLFRRCKIQIR